MTGKVFTGRILPALGLLIALVGLGLSIYLSMSAREEPAEGGPAAAALPLTAADFPAAAPEPGHQVGYRIPDFALELADGRAVTAAELVEQEQPTFLFFWATTWPVCTAELQRLQAIYPDYAPEVAFYAVGVHPGIVEDLATLERYRRERGHPWPVAVAPRQLLADLNVTIQSTKIAFDGQGIITYREGMGRGKDALWREVFADLAAGENAG